MENNSNKVVALEVGAGYDTSKCVKRNDFTTNKNYLGDLDGKPVYYNKKLKQGEIKEIMETKEYKTLPVGKYQAKVEQVIRKNNNGKQTISIEMSVDGVDELQYLTYCVAGYSEIQCSISKEQIDKVCLDFGITTIDELAGKDVVLTSKVNAKGFTNLYVAPKRTFFDGENFVGFKYSDKVSFDCDVKKFYQKGNKYIFYIVADIDGKNVEEFVVYDLDRQYGKENFDKALKYLDLTLEDVDKELSGKKAKLMVNKKVGDNRTFINKRLGFGK